MTSAADRLKAQLNAQFAAPGRQVVEERPPTARPIARTKRVRRTVDLLVPRHHWLTRWCDEQALAIGVARVPSQAVLEELVGLLATDVRTQDMVRQRLREKYDEKA